MKSTASPEAPGSLKQMKQTPTPSAWQVSIFTCEVFGGRCDYCNANLSADAMSQNFYDQHRGHIPAISLWARIFSPEEYRGLELRLRLELFVGRGRALLEQPLHLPCIVLKLVCTRCQAQTFPRAPADVTAFRAQHASHIAELHIHAVLQNFVGRALQQNVPVLSQHIRHSADFDLANASSGFAVDRAAQLCRLSRPLHCSLTAARCNACRTRYRLKDPTDVLHELSLHRCHWDSVHVHAMIEKPKDYAGRELEFPAFPFALSSLVSPDGVTINAILVKLFRQHGGPSITPNHAAEVATYIEAAEGRRNQPRFLALVRGQGGRVFQCDFSVIHVHSPSRSFPAISRSEESAWRTEMEEA